MKNYEIITSSITHKNGGIEQGFLQMIEDNKETELSKCDKERLGHLKSLPQNRTEIKSTSKFKEVVA